MDPLLLLDPLEVDLKAAGGGAELWEVLVELGDPAAEIGVLLDDVNLIAGLSRLDGGRDAGDATADHEDAPVNRTQVVSHQRSGNSLALSPLTLPSPLRGEEQS